MKGLAKIIAICGIVLVAYAIFSRFYGQPAVALKQFSSSNVLLLGNTVLIISLLLKDITK